MRTRGSSMVEFALAAPLLLLLLAGVLNYAVALRAAIAVADAARAGAQYGALAPANASDQAGISAVARNAAPALTGMTVASSQSCKCASGAAVSCSGSCASGPVEMYVQVITTATSPNWFSYPGLAYSGAVASQAMMRAK